MASNFSGSFSLLIITSQDVGAENSFMNIEGSSYAKSVILGGIDGVMAVVGITCACEGGGVDIKTLMIVVSGVIMAQALNIGIGEYLSSQAHRQFIVAEKRRVMWEYKQNPTQKKQIMTELFEAKGMTRADSVLITRKLSQYERFFVDLMITEELKLVLPEDDDAVLLFDSFVMFFSFAGFGCMPLLAYILVPLEIIDTEAVLPVALLISAALLFFLGGLKSIFSSVVWAFSSFEAIVMGTAVGAMAYFTAATVCSIGVV